MKYLKIPLEDLQKELEILSHKADIQWDRMCDRETVNEYIVKIELLNSIIKKYASNT